MAAPITSAGRFSPLGPFGIPNVVCLAALRASGLHGSEYVIRHVGVTRDRKAITAELIEAVALPYPAERTVILRQCLEALMPTLTDYPSPRVRRHLGTPCFALSIAQQVWDSRAQVKVSIFQTETVPIPDARPHVRFWHLADIDAPSQNVCFRG
jgi:hypothetical protein